MLKKSILFLMLISAFAFPMHRVSRLFTKANAAKVGSKALTVTGHSIAWGLPLYEGYQGVNSNTKTKPSYTAITTSFLKRS